MDKRLIRARLDHIRRSVVVERWPIDSWEARTADHIAPGEYLYDGDWQVVASDAAWPPDKTLFVRTQVDIPTGIPAEDLLLRLDVENMEGLVYVDDRPYAGVDANHIQTPVPALGSFILKAEFRCLGQPASYPAIRPDWARLREAAVVRLDADIKAAFYDLWFTWEASQHAPDERRRRLLHAALEEALLAVDLTAPSDQYRRDLVAADRRLRERVNAISIDPEDGRIFLTGHSHIDVAWLWPLRETIRKCGRTFSTACRLLERYPDYHISCSQPQLYAYTKEHYPDLYEEIKQWVQTGRWECTGGMWVESDCNVPSGESLIRQILYGLEFFREEFGTRPRSCWLPDVFGYPASLPGILKGCGLDAFLTCKLHWQARNPFPRHLFWWEGIDGNRILAHIPRLSHYYNGQPTPEQLRFAWRNFHEKERYPELLFPFGFGDGGGGPTEEMLELASRAREFPGIPRSRQGPEETYFKDVLEADPDLSTWIGELYLETHRGTYTTQAKVKLANRRNELLLREAEIWGVLARTLGASIDVTSLHQAWLDLLLLQFHDILPGSSIGEVYAEAAEQYAEIAEVGNEVRDTALDSLIARIGCCSDLVVFNSLPWERSDIVTATISDPKGAVEVVQPDGQAVTAQIIDYQDGQAKMVFVPTNVPSMGYTTLSLRSATQPVEHSLVVDELRMENRFYLLELTEDGEIQRLFDKRYGREVLPPDEIANRLQLFQDGPEGEDAWNVHATYDEREYDWDPGTGIEVLEEGPVRSAVRVTRRYRHSRLQQDIILYDRLPRIEFATQVNWQERQVMLKAAFPVDVRSMRGTFEIQFGAVERPTHRNTSWDQEKFEVCGHRWADLSESGYGVSLLDDCKYGYDIKGHILRLTLLRGPESPDPDADRGHHEFTYALFPHAGDWTTAGTVYQGWELNVPLVGLPGPIGEGSLRHNHSFFKVEGPAILGTVKPAEDGVGWILRFHEPHGSRGRVQIQTPWQLEKVLACNHVEEGGEDIPFEGHSFDFLINPFEVRTFHLHS